jgi:hypothetical protein
MCRVSNELGHVTYRSDFFVIISSKRIYGTVMNCNTKRVIFNLMLKYNPSGVFLVLDFEAVVDLCL